jgi:hypothetical protein
MPHHNWPALVLLAPIASFAVAGGDPDLRTHQTPSVYGTVTALGSIGREIEGVNSVGLGFGAVGEDSALWIASLWAATDLDYLCNRDYLADPKQEWRRLVGVAVTTTGEADEEFEARFDDGGHPAPRGLEVRQRSRSWNAPGSDRFVLLDYTLFQRGPQPLVDLYVGVFADMDLGGGAADSTLVEPANRLVYTYDKGLDPPAGVAGLVLLGQRSPAALTALRNEDFVHTQGNYLSDANKLALLRGELSFAAVDGDGSMLISLGPFTLAPGDSLEFAVALVHAYGEAAFRSAAASAEERWQEIRAARGVAIPVRSFSEFKARN